MSRFSYCDDAVPGNAGKFLPGWVGYLGCGFADYFNFLDQRQEQLAVGLQVVSHPSPRERHGLSRRIEHMAQTDGVMFAHIELQLRPTPSAGSRDSGPQRSSGRLCVLRRAQTVPAPCRRRPAVREYGPVRTRPTGLCRCRVRNHLAARNRRRRAVLCRASHRMRQVLFLIPAGVDSMFLFLAATDKRWGLAITVAST